MNENDNGSGPVTGRVSTGVTGLDEILHGGVPEGRIYLVHGEAGTGKTTTGLQFLQAASREGKRTLCITLLQTLSEINDVAASHGWSLDGVEVMELPRDVREAATMGQTVFTTADVELGEVADALERAIAEYEPDCLFIDSLSELGVLVDTGYQLRRQLIRLKDRLDKLSCTTLLSAGPSGGADIRSLETLVHGVVGLEMIAPEFGKPQRRIIVSKMRGMDFIGGYHDARIVYGGLVVFPRILAPEHAQASAGHTMPSGNARIDSLLGGGLETGSTCAVLGTSGAGKSTFSAMYAHAAAREGIRSALLCFDERPETLMTRASGLGMEIDHFVRDGVIGLRQMSVGEASAGELNHTIRQAVEEDGVRLVILDSVSGYLQAMPGEQGLITQLHELLSYLSAAGVLTIMIVTTHGLFGETEPGVDVSYIADAVVVLRHFEARGEVRRCIAVLKKRYGSHERTIREVRFGPGGVVVGEPLSDFTGVLSGLPRFEGQPGHLLGDVAAGRADAGTADDRTRS